MKSAMLLRKNSSPNSRAIQFVKPGFWLNATFGMKQDGDMPAASSEGFHEPKSEPLDDCGPLEFMYHVSC